jgi:hypothetical protein
MRIAVPGGGRIVWRRKHLRDAADLWEQNPMGVAWGLLSQQALETSREDDPETEDLSAQPWKSQ